jgi:linoleoyl-CoA desaturase
MQVTINKTDANGFSDEITNRVNAYFVGKSKKGTSALYSKTIIILLLLIGFYSLALWSGNIFAFAAVGCLIALAGFNVMHDASHGSYSDNKTLNKVLGFVVANLMGGDEKNWSIKHNLLHHTYTNIVGIDDDIGKTPLFRIAPDHEWKWFHKYQHIYCWFLYMFTTINWFYYDDFKVYFSKKIESYSFKLKPKDHITFWLGKILHIGLFIVVPCIVLGAWAIICLLVLHAIASLFLALVFQMAHVVEGVDFHSHDIQHIDGWYRHEVRTTADFASKSWLWTLLLGGLNYQVEHHLFRDVSHIHYPALARIVQEVCEKKQVKYVSFPTFRSAIASHYRHLRYMGQQELIAA